MHWWTRRGLLIAVSGLVLMTTLAGGTALAAKTDRAKFKMIVSPAAATCLPHAQADVTIRSLGPVEVMHVEVEGLPPNTDFDSFVIQQQLAPFGVSWYQGDVETNGRGKGDQRFIGRFNIETFAISPMAVTPLRPPHTSDATTGVAFAPIHTFHLGLWFNSPADAVKAGCPGATTPFNGDHTAGIQVLNTANFPDGDGPLRQINP